MLPQCLHFTATVRISSPQYGQAFTFSVISFLTPSLVNTGAAYRWNPRLVDAIVSPNRGDVKRGARYFFPNPPRQGKSGLHRLGFFLL
jgi:hypothetical protein